MKFQHLLLFVILTIYSNLLGAQDVDFTPKIKLGITGGYNHANATLNNVEGFTIKTLNSYNIGISSDFHLIRRFSLEPILLYSKKGFKILDQDLLKQNQYNYNFLSFQILAKFQLIKNITLLAGAENSYTLNVNISDSTWPFNRYEKIDLSLVTGVEFPIFEKWVLHFKYNHSITPFFEDPNSDVLVENHKVIMIGATFFPWRIDKE